MCGDVHRCACVHACYVDVPTVNGSLVLPFVTALLICSVWPKHGKMLTALFSSRLCGAAYNVDHARPLTADDLSVTTSASPLSPVPISRCCRSTLPITDRLRSSAHVPVSAAVSRRPAVPDRLTVAAAAADVRRSLTNWRPCVKFDVALMHRIVSYHIAIFCVISIVSYRFPLGPYRANTTKNVSVSALQALGLGLVSWQKSDVSVSSRSRGIAGRSWSRLGPKTECLGLVSQGLVYIPAARRSGFCRYLYRLS